MAKRKTSSEKPSPTTDGLKQWFKRLPKEEKDRIRAYLEFKRRRH